MSLFSRDSEQSAAERMRRLEMAHAERMKALELGQPLPEVEIARAKATEAKVRAEAGRAVGVAVFMALGPVAVLAIAVAATAVTLASANPSIHQPVLTVIWVSSAVVSLAVAVAGWACSQKLPLRDLFREQQSMIGPREASKLSQAIQE
jgi:hypothetical protein